MKKYIYLVLRYYVAEYNMKYNHNINNTEENIEVLEVNINKNSM